MTTKKRLRKQFKRYADRAEPATKLYSGALGIYIGGTQYVDVPNRPGFVYVRLMNDISQLIQVHNQTVSPVYDLPVLVVRANNRYEIYGRDVAQYGSYWDSPSSYIPRHARQHEFDPDNNGGGDLVFVRGEQFYPMMTFPSGSAGANNVLIAPYRYYHNSQWFYTGNTGTPDLLQYRPTGSANAKLILIGITEDTGNPFVKTGVEFSANITGAAELTSYVPTNITLGEELPGAIVRLVTGTQVITWANIYDARQYMGILADPNTFLGLSDTPDSYSGQANRVVVVKPDESGLEFVSTVTGSAGGFADGIQETWYPTRLVSSFTGSSSHVGTYYPYSGTYYQLNFVPGNGLTQVNSTTLLAGNNQPAFVFATETSYDLESWLLRGEYTLVLNLVREIGSHPMEAYCQLLIKYGGTEQLLATSSLAKKYDGTTDILDENFGETPYAFRMSLDETAFTYDGPIFALNGLSSPKRLVVKVLVNATSGGADGYLGFVPGARDFLNINLQREVLDNHYFPLSGTFTSLSDTPDSYSGQANKFVAVNTAANGLEFVNSPVGTGGSGIVALDDSVYKLTGSVVSFDNALGVDITGTTAYINYKDIGARVYGDTLIVTGSANIIVPFTGEAWDTDNMHSLTGTTLNTRLTVNTPGKYLFIGQAEWAANATGARQMWLLKNGAKQLARVLQDSVTASNVTRHEVMTIEDMVIGDYVQMFVFQNSGGNLNIQTGSAGGYYSPALMAQKIG